MRNIFITTLSLFSPILLFAQAISGQVIDKQTKAPIDFATVYFDGTTRGTTTDDGGDFELSTAGISLPASLVISHLNYDSYTTTITTVTEGLSYSLEPRAVNIKVVEVADKDQRQKNLEEFRRIFLGSDDWGRRAKIANEDDLFFSRDYERVEVKQKTVKLESAQLSSDLRNIEWALDSSSFQYEKAVNFKIDASAPLQIDLPDLGYTLTVDLISCELNYKTQIYSFLGHFFFQPYEQEGEKTKAKHRKNRALAYYNSRQHFCRALYNNALAQNGYKIYERVQKPGQWKGQDRPFSFAPFLQYLEEDQLDIQNLAGRNLTILYHAKATGRPVDLRRKRKGIIRRSGLEIGSNSCIVRADGTMGMNALFFSGSISQKLVSALLPNDYEPPEE